ncbi:MAG: hypothetical protein GY906_11720 [bacterium]|nr:hypothetical protein [bacterium]
MSRFQRLGFDPEDGWCYAITRLCGHVDKLTVPPHREDPDEGARKSSELLCYDCWEDQLEPPATPPS